MPISYALENSAKEVREILTLIRGEHWTNDVDAVADAILTLAIVINKKEE
jgi:hypothetical protein